MKTFYKNKQVLVTGGCGFIGSHIVCTLIDLGAQVTVIDDLSTGFVNNIEPVGDQITFIHKSITDPQVCDQATRDVDIIFHLAAFISVPQSVAAPQRCHEVNVDGTVNLLEAARKNGVDRFIFSSSAAVYGTPDAPCAENSTPHPESPYATSKLIGELYCQMYAQIYQLNTICMRYFNVYGERQNPHAAYAAVVAKFNDLMSQNKPVTIFGDGLQTRDFIPIEQVVEANLMLGMLPPEQLNGDLYNVATGKSMTVLELFDQLKEGFPGYNLEPTFAAARLGDIKHSQAVCTKMKRLYDEFIL